MMDDIPEDMHGMFLWYVRADTDVGDSLDLLVRTDTAASALKHWHIHFELDYSDTPYYIGRVPLDQIGPIDWQRIFDNPATVHYKEIP